MEIRPHRSVGAGRARGAFAFELVTFAKASSSHIALQGGPIFGAEEFYVLQSLQRGLAFGDVFLDDFWLCFVFPAMGISVLEEILIFDWFFVFILLRSRATGESVLPHRSLACGCARSPDQGNGMTVGRTLCLHHMMTEKLRLKLQILL